MMPGIGNDHLQMERFSNPLRDVIEPFFTGNTNPGDNECRKGGHGNSNSGGNGCRMSLSGEYTYEVSIANGSDGETGSK